MTFSNTLNVLSDVKELIPEFYIGNGDFLKNTHTVTLGKDNLNKQVGDVNLPNWASSSTEFVTKMRAALECNFVST